MGVFVRILGVCVRGVMLTHGGAAKTVCSIAAVLGSTLPFTTTVCLWSSDREEVRRMVGDECVLVVVDVEM